MKIKYKLEQLNERNIYIKELERKNTELRKFKHDYKNFLLSLSVSLKSNDINNDSIQNLLIYADKNVDSNISIDNTNLYQLKDDLVRGIIVTKLMFAKEKSIRTDFEIDENVSIPKNHSVEITRIMGILLDNAIDACLLTDQPTLNFAIVSFENYVEFIVGNNVSPQVSINVNDVYQTGFTTKENHSGLGLTSVREIVDSSADLFIQNKIKNGYYSTILTVLEDEQCY